VHIFIYFHFIHSFFFFEKVHGMCRISFNFKLDQKEMKGWKGVGTGWGKNQVRRDKIII